MAYPIGIFLKHYKRVANSATLFIFSLQNTRLCLQSIVCFVWHNYFITYKIFYQAVFMDKRKLDF